MQTMTQTEAVKHFSPDDIPTLVIGDLHGHLDRLEALLTQEDLLGPCTWCDATGQVDEDECVMCDGDAIRRTDKPAHVVLLGDIGHFGKDGSLTGDIMTLRAAILWADTILWGNHDRACVAAMHAFSGYIRPTNDVYDFFERARRENKLKLAHSEHGYLFTHAGLHLAFERNKHIPEAVKTDPKAFASWINMVEDPDAPCHPSQKAVRDAISTRRGGPAPAGGILWRDITEKLYDGFPQVFGHSADHQEHEVRFCAPNFYTRSRKDFDTWSKVYGDVPASYCIDIGGKSSMRGSQENCLAGIWLPTEEIVRVQL